LRAEVFSFSLDISIAIFDPKKVKSFSAVFFVLFGHQNPGAVLDPDPYPDYESGSRYGSRDPIESRSNPDLDPQKWV